MRNRILLIFLLVLAVIFSVYSKTNFDFDIEQKVDSLICDTIYSRLDTLVIQPEYKNGVASFLRFNEQVAKPPPIIMGNIPAKARVVVEFYVDKRGKVFDPSILRIVRIIYDKEFDKITQEWRENIDFDYCQKEAFRILYLVEFIPAKKNDTNVCFGKMTTIINVYYGASGYD